MEKSEIVRKFLSSGYGLDSSSLDFFINNTNRIHEFLAKTKKLSQSPPILTLDYVNSVLSDNSGSTSSGSMRIMRNFFIEPKNKKFSTEDAFFLWSNRYENYRKIISEKMRDTVSINRAQKQETFSLVVVVREKVTETTALVEDLTGNISVVFGDRENAKEILEGDIVGLVCSRKHGDVFVKRVVFPDIPLKREISKTKDNILCIFTTKTNKNLFDWAEKNNKKYDGIIIFGINDMVGENGSSLFDISGMKALFCDWDKIKKYSKKWGSAENVILNLLKRRSLSPCTTMEGKSFWENNEFLDITPDIFVTNNETESSTNYKGITILSIGTATKKPSPWSINLKTREINKPDLS